jgi:cobalt/nickel transport system permease protein
MHIPDNFLSTPVWAAMDAAGIASVGLMLKRAGKELEDARIPFLGVMGAFVFAAQMINFPVGVGTSGHLVGGALLACTLGVAPAALIMTVIIAMQAFVFQDGGVLALGANVFNMAIAGVLAGYWPYRIWGARWRRSSIFAGAVLSVMVSATLALSELLISGVRMPRPLILVSVALFAVSALIEGAITVSVMQAMERLNPAFVRTPRQATAPVLAMVGGVALVLAVAGFLVASTTPDGIQRLGAELGLGGNAIFRAPLPDYSFTHLDSAWLRRATGGLAGLLLIFAACAGASRVIGRQRSA